MGGPVDEDGLVNSANERGPVLDTGRHVAAENIIEGGVVKPWAFHVIYFELHIGRDPTC